MANRIIQRHDTAANWDTHNPILAEGELGFISDQNNRYKIGDGVTPWKSLTLQGFNGNIVNETGDDEGAVMSQKGVTTKLTELESEINNEVVPIGAGVNLLNPQARHLGYWIGANGNLVSVNENYGYYGYIEIEPNTQYYASNKNNRPLSQRDDTYIAFYDEKKHFISATSASVPLFITPTNAKYINLSFDVVLEDGFKPMLNQGTKRAFYEDFNPVRKYLNDIQNEISSLQSVTQEKIYFSNIETYQSVPVFPLLKGAKIINNGVSLILAENAQLGGRIDVATGETIYLDSDKNYVQTKDTAGDVDFDYIYISDDIKILQNKMSIKAENIPQVEYVSRDIFMSAGGEFTTLGTFLCGWGYGSTQGQYVVVTPTELQIYNRGTWEYLAHNITLEKYLTVTINVKTGVADISLLSGNGQFFQVEKSWLGRGIPFSIFRDSEGASDTKKVMKKRIASPIWMYGDSYFSYDSSYRWTYFLIEWGYLNWFANHLPGGTTGDLLPAFEADLKCGCPQYALWALGMNDETDVDNDTPDSVWLANTQEFLKICKDNNITPILTTTPSVPSRNHEGKNKWVRESGYRYIDFADAVGASADGEWTSGMLYIDGVHPTPVGARALAMRTLLDFPEITIVA